MQAAEKVIYLYPGQPKTSNSGNYKSNGVHKANAADDIRDPEIIRQIQEKLLEQPAHGYRNWMLFTMGINIGRRCGDLLSLRVADILNMDGSVREEVSYYDDKTSTTKYFYIQPTLAAELKKYVVHEHLRGMNYLFPSQRGKLSVNAVWRILRDVEKDLQLTINLSTHSMRKTYGRNIYENFGIDAAAIALGHANPANTMRYIGVKKDEQKAIAMSVPMLGVQGVPSYPLKK